MSHDFCEQIHAAIIHIAAVLYVGLLMHQYRIKQHDLCNIIRYICLLYVQQAAHGLPIKTVHQKSILHCIQQTVSQNYRLVNHGNY